MRLDKPIVCEDWILLSLHCVHAAHRRWKTQTHVHTCLVWSSKHHSQTYARFDTHLSCRQNHLWAELLYNYIWWYMYCWVAPCRFPGSMLQIPQEAPSNPHNIYRSSSQTTHMWDSDIYTVYKCNWQPCRALQFCRWTWRKYGGRRDISSAVTSETSSPLTPGQQKLCRSLKTHLLRRPIRTSKLYTVYILY